MPAANENLVVFLHGVGAFGTDMASLADALGAALPSTAFAAPDAPSPFDGGGSGRQWFSLSGVTAANRRARIEAAREAFDRVTMAAVAERGFAGRLDRVALFGFSQGAMMALDAVASGRWPVVAAVAAAGRLSGSAAPLAAANAARVLLLHGEADPVVPVEESRLAAERLTAAGFCVEARFYPRVGHALTDDGVAAAGEFLVRAFKRV